MLAQVLWRQIVYKIDTNDKTKTEYGSIPQGTLVFVASKSSGSVKIIYNEMILVVSSAALRMINKEEDLLPLEILQAKYHNNRNSPCILE